MFLRAKNTGFQFLNNFNIYKQKHPCIFNHTLFGDMKVILDAPSAPIASCSIFIFFKLIPFLYTTWRESLLVSVNNFA